jgi:tetratricopeptide (TPR) repeat protein
LIKKEVSLRAQRSNLGGSNRGNEIASSLAAPRNDNVPLRCRQLLRSVVVFLTAFVCSSYAGAAATAADSRALPAATPLASDTDQVVATIRSLEDKVKQNPDDFIAYTKLAGYYLQRQRETGSNEYLSLAGRAARASLAIVPAERNYSGLAALAQTEYALHNFAGARDYALQLTTRDAAKSIGWQILSDAFLELGEYDKARRALERMQEAGEPTSGTQSRLGKYALLRGRPQDATRYLSEALVLALKEMPPSRETVAWCRWQLGEVAFSLGDYQNAEQHYREALVTFPHFWRATAALARVRAARGDFSEAITLYELVVKSLPELSFVAALGDVYHLRGRAQEAAAQYALVEQIAKLDTVNGSLYNRQLALFYADHDLQPQEAYAKAMKEYSVRRDIYGADSVAWTALKANKLTEAKQAVTEALRLGTRDARILYHAGMIAIAAGKHKRGCEYLTQALTLNPGFDPLQASIARKTLAAQK